jgi:hypothetical protein
MTCTAITIDSDPTVVRRGVETGHCVADAGSQEQFAQHRTSTPIQEFLARHFEFTGFGFAGATVAAALKLSGLA